MSNKKQLHEILRTMDVPIIRMEDFGWLKRNLAIRNEEHPKFNEAMDLIKKIEKGNNGN